MVRLLFSFFFFLTHLFIYAQSEKLIGLIDHQLVEINTTNTGLTVFSNTTIPPSAELRNLTYAVHNCLFYSIQDFNASPKLVAIDNSGNFSLVNTITMATNTVYTVESIAYNKLDSSLYASASLNAVDFTSEALIKINSDDATATLVALLNPNGTVQTDIDKICFDDQLLHVVDAAPPGTNLLNFYTQNFTSISNPFSPNLINSYPYQVILDITLFNDLIYFPSANFDLLSYAPSSGNINNNGPTHTQADFNGASIVGIANYTQNPNLNIFNIDTSLCLGEQISLNVAESYDEIFWSTGQTSNTISITSDQTVSAELQIGACIYQTDTAVINFQSCQNLCENEFINFYSNADSTITPVKIVGSNNNGYYIAGITNQNNADENNSKIFVSHFNSNDALQWTKTIDPFLTKEEEIRNMQIDSEDNLLLTGGSYLNNQRTEGFYLKFNTSNFTIEWCHIMNQFPNADEAPIGLEFEEISNNGNYILSGSVYVVGCDLLLAEIDRNTGVQISNKLYSIGICESLSDVLIKNNFIFGVGRYTQTGGTTNKMRAVFSKFNLNLNEVLSKYYFIEASNDARMYSNFIIEDDEDFVMVGFGDDDGASPSDVDLYFSKIDSSGDLIWSNRLDIPIASTERFSGLVKVNDGYIAAGYFNNGTEDQNFLLKLNFNGALVWGKSFDASSVTKFKDLVFINNYLYLIAETPTNQTGEMTTVKVNANTGELSQCPSLTLTVNEALNVNLNSFTNDLIELLEIQDNTTNAVPMNSASLSELVYCNTFQIQDSAQIYMGCQGDGYSFVTTNGTVYDESNPTGMETIFSTNGCVYELNIDLTFGGLYDLKNDFYICYGDSLEFENDVLTAGASKQYNFESINGCDSLVSVTVIGAPEIELFGSSSYIFKPNELLQLDLTTSVINPQIEWIPNIHLSCNSCLNPTFDGLYNQDYILSITDMDFGCTKEFNISVREKEGTIHIPSSFSPNLDGINDEFKILPDVEFSEYHLKIFNRWGEVVFETFNSTEYWDGRYANFDQEISVFIYMLKAESINGKEYYYKGNVTLIK